MKTRQAKLIWLFINLCDFFSSSVWRISTAANIACLNVIIFKHCLKQKWYPICGFLQLKGLYKWWFKASCRHLSCSFEWKKIWTNFSNGFHTQINGSILVADFLLAEMLHSNVIISISIDKQYSTELDYPSF